MKPKRTRSNKDDELASVGTLKLTVHSGTNLAPKDPNGLSDPYVYLGYFIQNYKSEIVRKTLNPKWNFTVEIPVTLATTVSRAKLMYEVLQIECWDWDKFSADDFEGQIVRTKSHHRLSQLQTLRTTAARKDYPLEKRASHPKEEITGSLSISFEFVPEPGRLAAAKKESIIRRKRGPRGQLTTTPESALAPAAFLGQVLRACDTATFEAPLKQHRVDPEELRARFSGREVELPPAQLWSLLVALLERLEVTLLAPVWDRLARAFGLRPAPLQLSLVRSLCSTLPYSSRAALETVLRIAGRAGGTELLLGVRALLAPAAVAAADLRRVLDYCLEHQTQLFGDTATLAFEQSNDVIVVQKASLPELLLLLADPFYVDKTFVRCLGLTFPYYSTFAELLAQHRTLLTAIHFDEAAALQADALTPFIKSRLIGQLKQFVEVNAAWLLADPEFRPNFEAFLGEFRALIPEAMLQRFAEFLVPPPPPEPAPAPPAHGLECLFEGGEAALDRLAEQLTLLDFDLMARIDVCELLKNRHTRRPQAPTFYATVDAFNSLTRTVATTVLAAGGKEERAEAIARWVRVAARLCKLGSYNSAMGISAGLGHTAISRLWMTWPLLSKKSQADWAGLEQLFSLANNLQTYRDALARQPSNKPVVPYLGVLPKDLIAIEEGNPNFLDEARTVVNFRKMRWIDRAAAKVQTWRQYPFAFARDARLLPVLQSLDRLALTEDQLYQRSLELEPRRPE